MTPDDLRKAFASAPAAWRDSTPAWTPALAARIADAVRGVSGARPIGPTDPFRALRLCAPDRVKAIIVGQDPYPTPGQADGLSFSAEKISPRPSLRRVFDVLEADRPGWRRPVGGRLDAWARQGVLLLNTALTVELGRAGSHLPCGWQALTLEIVKTAARCSPPGVAILAWGRPAQAFAQAALEGLTAQGRAGVRLLATRHPSNDFQRGFMAEGSHFVATADRVDWWAVATPEDPKMQSPGQNLPLPGI